MYPAQVVEYYLRLVVSGKLATETIEPSTEKALRENILVSI